MGCEKQFLKLRLHPSAHAFTTLSKPLNCSKSALFFSSHHTYSKINLTILGYIKNYFITEFISSLFYFSDREIIFEQIPQLVLYTTVHKNEIISKKKGNILNLRRVFLSFFIISRHLMQNSRKIVGNIKVKRPCKQKWWWLSQVWKCQWLLNAFYKVCNDYSLFNSHEI